MLLNSLSCHTKYESNLLCIVNCDWTCRLLCFGWFAQLINLRLISYVDCEQYSRMRLFFFWNLGQDIWPKADLWSIMGTVLIDLWLLQCWQLYQIWKRALWVLEYRTRVPYMANLTNNNCITCLPIGILILFMCLLSLEKRDASYWWLYINTSINVFVPKKWCHGRICMIVDSISCT